jgi:excisionase family DNA binding protein
MSTPEKVTYRVKDLVAATGLSRSTVWTLIRTGELPSFKFQGMRLVLKSDLDAWLAKVSGRDTASLD